MNYFIIILVLVLIPLIIGEIIVNLNKDRALYDYTPKQDRTYAYIIFGFIELIISVPVLIFF